MKRSPYPLGSRLGPLALVACACFLAACDSGGGATTDASQVPYPLEVCVVSGEPLDSMGGPVTITFEGRTVKFCCDHCIAEFRKDPAPRLAKLDAATRH